jgi:hypothetical protein
MRRCPAGLMVEDSRCDGVQSAGTLARLSDGVRSWLHLTLPERFLREFAAIGPCGFYAGEERNDFECSDCGVPSTFEDVSTALPSTSEHLYKPSKHLPAFGSIN